MFLRWTARLVAVLVGAFLALFAMDAASGPDLLVHLLPTAIVAGVVAIAWHKEWIGALAFTTMAAGYTVLARDHLSWIAIIAVPLFVAAALYLLSWRQRRSGFAR